MKIKEIKMNQYLEMISDPKNFAYVIAAYLSIDVELFGILLTILFINSVFGAIREVRFGVDFSKKKFLWGWALKHDVLIILLAVFVLGKAAGKDFSIGVDAMLRILIVAEIYSILGNFYMIRTKKKVKKFDIVTFLIKLLRNKIEFYLRRFKIVIESKGDCEMNNKDKEI
jgi:hypothetical protein